MDSKSVDGQMLCYGVREHGYPQDTDFVLVVLAAIAVIINFVEMVSVLRNYRRLRQRIYVFVISLAAANVVGGIVFLADAANRIANGNYEQSESDDAETLLYQKSTHDGRKYVTMKDNGEANVLQELLQNLKASCIVLSALSVSLVTFALYKRTTSMGKHHEDFKSADSPFGPDGRPFLPAFDTMMRVLSVGSPIVVNSLGKNMGRGNTATQNNNRPIVKRGAAPTNILSSSLNPDELGSGTRQSHVVKSSAENSSRKQNEGSTGRLFGNVANVFRRASGAPAYVGRHSNSVMSKSVTGCSLVFIWLTFIVMSTLPFALRRLGNVDAVCPDKCRTVEITQVTSSDAVDVVVASTEDVNANNTAQATTVFQEDSAINGCVPGQFRTMDGSRNTVNDAQKSPCSSCSAAFFPLSKSNMIFVALVAVFTWCWLVVSASRLLYLRKHSTNVFVRCSALWRFMFMTAAFSVATVAPYVVWILADFTTSSSADKSILWHSAPVPQDVNLPGRGDIYYAKTGVSQTTLHTATQPLTSSWDVVAYDSSYLLPIYGFISTCLLLVNFTVGPTLYLIRLLGFRRILSAI